MEEMRLQKYMALCGVASRRQAEHMITYGRVTVNGTVVSVQGYKVSQGDIVTVNGKVISPEKNKFYVLLNKPKGVVSTAKDESGRKTVLDCIPNINERLYPVGRLDFGTSGLIILSNDGDFTKFMTHPSHEVGKTYIVEVNGQVDAKLLDVFKNGVDIGDYTTAPAKVSEVLDDHRHKTFRITIYEGKNRQIRRMVEAVGLRVRSLEGVGIGNIYDPGLKSGGWRHLTAKEIRGLGYAFD